MILIHAKKYSPKYKWETSEYQDWIINEDQILFCDTNTSRIYLTGDEEDAFQVLKAEWEQVKFKLLKGKK